MPGAQIYEDEVERLETHDEWFDLKRKLSYGDKRRLDAEFLMLGSKFQKGEVTPDAGRPMLLLISIKAWSLKDRDGKPVPVNDEEIDRLDPEIVEVLIAEINRRNPAPKAPILTEKSGLPLSSSTKGKRQ